MATGSHSPPLSMDSKLHILFLGTEWGSSQDDFSTLNRELAKHFAKCPKIGRVSFLVPPGKAVQAKGEALEYNVHLVEATDCPGMDMAQSLSFPLDSLGNIDVVIGCGLQLGPQAKRIKDMKQCIWVQFVHESSEDLGMFKGIAEYEEKHEDEIKLCRMADLVVALGPKLADTIPPPLCSERTVIELIPGIFEQFTKLTPAEKGRRVHRVFLFGDTDLKDFELKGFDVAAKAIGSMHRMKYDLIFVGAPEGKQDEVKKLLLQEGIATKQLTVRSLCESQERLSRMFLEADLCILPSRTEGFGLTALKAMSAGTPILVSGNSGFGQALHQVNFGSSCIVDSDDPEVWSSKMEDILKKERSQRLDEAARIRDAYSAKYSWKEECNKIVESICRIKLQDVDKEHYVPPVQAHVDPGPSQQHISSFTGSAQQALLQESSVSPGSSYLSNVRGQCSVGLPGNSIPQPAAQQFQQQDCQIILEEIKCQYQKKNNIKPFPWLDDFQLTLEEIYTRLKIVSKPKEGGRHVLSGEAIELNQIFQAHNGGKQPRIVLIEADPGKGKSTLCQKLCFDWSTNSTSEPFPHFEVVLLIKCRDMESVEILDVVADQNLPELMLENKSALFDYIKRYPSKVLLIVDGLDELQSDLDLSDLIQGKILSSSTYLLVTTRQEAGIRMRQYCDSVLEITGYTVPKAKEYITKYFKLMGKEDKAQYLLSEIDKEPVNPKIVEDGGNFILELIRNPLTTSLLCLVCEDYTADDELPSRRTLLYEEITCGILRRQFTKEKKEVPEEPLQHCKEDLLTLGKLAFRGIEKDQLHFDARELASQPSIAKLGFLSKEAAASKRKPGFTYSFSHKTFQEFFAALFLCQMLVSGEVTVNNFIRQHLGQRLEKIKKFAQTLIFSAGILAEKGEMAVLFDLVESLTRALTTVFVVTAGLSSPVWVHKSADVTYSFGLLSACVCECSVGDQLTADQERMCELIGQVMTWDTLWLGERAVGEKSVRWKVLCKVMKFSRTVKLLDLNNNGLTDVSLLVNSLKNNNVVLEYLSLVGNPITDFTGLRKLKRRNKKLHIVALKPESLSTAEYVEFG